VARVAPDGDSPARRPESRARELRELESADREEDFRRVYLRANAPGPQTERWFHAYGCRRWLTLSRDTVTNEIHGLV
jgi:heterotetrameric sarcosine oxidase delta subunit